MTNSAPPTKLAIVVAANCVIAEIIVNQFIPIYQEISNELGASLPLATQLFLYTYRWLWLGAVFSGIVWLCSRRHILSNFWSRGILYSILILVAAYVPLGLMAMYLPIFELPNSVGS